LDSLVRIETFQWAARHLRRDDLSPRSVVAHVATERAARG
jgi:hypothetical protein